MNILADASLPNLDVLFTSSCVLTTYRDLKQVYTLLPGQDVLICRSTLKVTQALLEESHLTWVATASSGIDHIDKAYLKKRNIGLIDAKGCNADAVADYVLSCLALLSQERILKGKRAGVIGVGAVGSKIVNQLRRLGFEVIASDPLSQTRLPHLEYTDLEAMASCDLICLHASLHDEGAFATRQLLDAHFFDALKSTAILINAARGDIVDEQALLNCKHPIIYCTDVFSNEPDINPEIIKRATLCTPHIAGHSIEAKQHAVRMIRDKLYQANGLQYLLTPEVEKAPRELNFQSGWESIVLAKYNPMMETTHLKSATNKKEAFLNLRKSHDFRHDFGDL